MCPCPLTIPNPIMHCTIDCDIITRTNTEQVQRFPMLTHWGRVTHICIGNQTISSDNGLLPSWRQSIIWTNAGILSVRTLGKNFSEFLIKIHIFSFKKMFLKMSFRKWQPFCLGLSVLMNPAKLGYHCVCRYPNIWWYQSINVHSTD